MIQFFTTGVYGLDSEQFFHQLITNEIDTFIDIRRRRAVRGSKYSFVNSKKLQSKLSELNINYLYASDLAPSSEIRRIQSEVDKHSGVRKQERNKLSDLFIELYNSQVLDRYDFTNLLLTLGQKESKKAIFFCVEKEPNACHRSLVTKRLHELFAATIRHL